MNVGVKFAGIALCDFEGCRRRDGHRGRHDAWPAEVWEFLEPKDLKKLAKAGFATPRGGAKGAYQNHVDRSNRVIIPYELLSSVDLSKYQDGFVIRLFPDQYFLEPGVPKSDLTTPLGPIIVGENAFVLYRTHKSFEKFAPPPTWRVRSLMKAGKEVHKRGLGVVDIGEYVLRLPTAGRTRKKRHEGPPQGLFATEYADQETNFLCMCVLAWLIVQTVDSPYTLAQAGHLTTILSQESLDDVSRYEHAGVLKRQLTQCPLCLRFIRYPELHQTVVFDEEVGLANAPLQVEGATRSTIVNLFHLRPLFYHELVHVPSNVAWGHAVCNTRLGQRPCYSLAEIIEMERKVGVVYEDRIETFGWMSEDDVMIRSAGGAVWIQIAAEGDEGPPETTEQRIEAAELSDESEEANEDATE